ncbi:MAG: cell division protein ZipA [Gammaproteobacteria bacterium]|nr:MAG: cell division protein ZipA [Gammaproteobacteria bacterium]
MDIKDWILIGGGILLVGVIAHGFWLAWHNRQDTLRMAIDPNIPHEEVDELILLRGELPNGGARLAEDPAQGDLDLATEAPVLMEQTGSRRTVEPTIGSEAFRLEPDEVQSQPLAAPEALSPVEEPSRQRARKAGRPRKASVRDDEAEASPGEIIVINVLARGGATFPGDKIMEVFLRNELRFGDMNIFHRIDGADKTVQFSVASAVEPGTFDLSAMAEFSTLGITMFLRLPGLDEPLPVFDDMLCVARDIASSLGGDLKDEQLSVMTGQTSEHCRQRIAEFSRKRMSQRA